MNPLEKFFLEFDPAGFGGRINLPQATIRELVEECIDFAMDEHYCE